MSTRKLIAASLVCGLLILVAGTVKLLQGAADEVAPVGLLKVGAAAEFGDVRVTVERVEVAVEQTLVDVQMSGLAGASPLDGWSMLADGEITEPIGSKDCPSSVDDVSCTLVFAPSVGTPTIVHVRGDERRQWLGE
ncbi:MAG: hypothetical protein ACKOAI_07290 [Acidimicrobiia bacterium]